MMRTPSTPADLSDENLRQRPSKIISAILIKYPGGMDISIRWNKFLIDIVTALHKVAPDADEATVYQNLMQVFREQSVLSTNGEVMAFLIALRTARNPCREGEQMIVDHLDQIKNEGAFAKTLEVCTAHVSASLFGVFTLVKQGLLRTGDMPVAEAKPTGAMRVVSNPTPGHTDVVADDSTGYLDMDSVVDPRSTSSLDNVIDILRNTPQHQEADLMQRFLERATTELPVDQALRLLRALNDPQQINITEICRNPVWNFLWKTRSALWARADLRSTLFPHHLQSD